MCSPPTVFGHTWWLVLSLCPGNGKESAGAASPGLPPGLTGVARLAGTGTQQTQRSAGTVGGTPEPGPGPAGGGGNPALPAVVLRSPTWKAGSSQGGAGPAVTGRVTLRPPACAKRLDTPECPGWVLPSSPLSPLLPLLWQLTDWGNRFIFQATTAESLAVTAHHAINPSGPTLARFSAGVITPRASVSDAKGFRCGTEWLSGLASVL